MFLEDVFGLKDKVAIVTGGNKGIGRVVALGLAKAGAEVVIFSRTGAEESIADITAAGGNAYHVTVDVTDPAQVDAAVSEVAEKSGKVIEVNLLGEYTMARAVAAVMKEKGIKGSIINMASMSAHIVNIPNLQCAYNTSKAAILHMTRSLAIEWVEYGIRVNSLSPGYIATPMSADVEEELKQAWYKLIPMRRMGDPEELLPAILYLASGSAGYTTGTDVIVDGGYICL